MIKKFLFIGATFGMLFLNACKDDGTTTEPTNTTGGGTGSNCIIKSTTDSDSDNYDYTFEGGKLVKVVDSYTSGTDTYIYTYTGDKVTEITEGTTSYKVTYTGNNVSRVDVWDGAMLEGFHLVTVDGSGKLSKVETYYSDGTNNILEERFVYTFTGDNCSKIVWTIDSDGDGALDIDITSDMKSFDNNTNPYYGLPIYLLEFDNPFYLCKNNPTGAVLTILTDITNASMTYTYDANGLPSKSVQTVGTDATTTEYKYSCD